MNVNPCVELMEKQFEYFGFETGSGCDICGTKPARVEPRFLYTSCQNHSILNPIRFSRVVNGEEKDPLNV